jgi:hypothetical protein
MPAVTTCNRGHTWPVQMHSRSRTERGVPHVVSQVLAGNYSRQTGFRTEQSKSPSEKPEFPVNLFGLSHFLSSYLDRGA